MTITPCMLPEYARLRPKLCLTTARSPKYTSKQKSPINTCQKHVFAILSLLQKPFFPKKRSFFLASKHSARENRPSTFESRASTFESRASTFESRASTFESKASTFENKPSTYASRASTYASRPSTFESRVFIIANRPSFACKISFLSLDTVTPSAVFLWIKRRPTTSTPPIPDRFEPRRRSLTSGKLVRCKAANPHISPCLLECW